MSMNEMATADVRWQEYLTARGLAFEREPDPGANTTPDFAVDGPHGRVIAEVKPFETTAQRDATCCRTWNRRIRLEADVPHRAQRGAAAQAAD